MILFFHLLMSCIALINLRILNHTCIPGINPTCPWCMTPRYDFRWYTVKDCQNGVRSMRSLLKLSKVGILCPCCDLCVLHSIYFSKCKGKIITQTYKNSLSNGTCILMENMDIKQKLKICSLLVSDSKKKNKTEKKS